MSHWNLDEITRVTCRHRGWEPTEAFLTRCRYEMSRPFRDLPWTPGSATFKRHRQEDEIERLTRLIEAEECRLKTRKAIASYFDPRIMWTAHASA